MTVSQTEIVNYAPHFQADFERLNRAWIEKFFRMEPDDEKVLRDPQRYILDEGGFILMAIVDGAAAGTIAVRKLGDGEFEFTKMAVDPAFQRRGIAEALSYAALARAKERGIDHLILYTNSGLKPAIALYEKLGFRFVTDFERHYERGDVKMIFDLNNYTSK